MQYRNLILSCTIIKMRPDTRNETGYRGKKDLQNYAA